MGEPIEEAIYSNEACERYKTQIKIPFHLGIINRAVASTQGTLESCRMLKDIPNLSQT